MLKYVLGILLMLGLQPAAATEAGWALLREGGQVVLLRHAYAPGSTTSREPLTGSIGDCGNGRGLSERGRQQARRIGALFAARAAPIDDVLSSRSCRSLDTATIAFGVSDVEEFPALDPLNAEGADPERQFAETLARVSGHRGYGNLVMITDLENIAGLTGASAREGEALIVVPDGEGLRVAARIVFN